MEQLDVYIRGWGEMTGESPEVGLVRLFRLHPLRALEFVQSVPRVVKRRLPREQAERYAQTLRQIGAIVELRASPIVPQRIMAVADDSKDAHDAYDPNESGRTLTLPPPAADAELGSDQTIQRTPPPGASEVTGRTIQHVPPPVERAEGVVTSSRPPPSAAAPIVAPRRLSTSAATQSVPPPAPAPAPIVAPRKLSTSAATQSVPPPAPPAPAPVPSASSVTQPAFAIPVLEGQKPARSADPPFRASSETLPVGTQLSDLLHTPSHRAPAAPVFQPPDQTVREVAPAMAAPAAAPEPAQPASAGSWFQTNDTRSEPPSSAASVDAYSLGDGLPLSILADSAPLQPPVSARAPAPPQPMAAAPEALQLDVAAVAPPRASKRPAVSARPKAGPGASARAAQPAGPSLQPGAGVRPSQTPDAMRGPRPSFTSGHVAVQRTARASGIISHGSKSTGSVVAALDKPFRYTFSGVLALFTFFVITQVRACEGADDVNSAVAGWGIPGAAVASPDETGSPSEQPSKKAETQSAAGGLEASSWAESDMHQFSNGDKDVVTGVVRELAKLGATVTVEGFSRSGPLTIASKLLVQLPIDLEKRRIAYEKLRAFRITIWHFDPGEAPEGDPFSGRSQLLVELG